LSVRPLLTLIGAIFLSSVGATCLPSSVRIT